MPTAHVADKPLGRRIDPADYARLVEDVARDTEALESLLDIAAHRQHARHRSAASPSTTPWPRGRHGDWAAGTDGRPERGGAAGASSHPGSLLNPTRAVIPLGVMGPVLREP